MSRPRSESDDGVERFEVRIFFRQIAEGAVHLETDLQVRFGIADIAEERFVASHVVVIDRLFQQRDGTGDEKLFRFGSLAELVEAETSMEKSGAAGPIGETMMFGQDPGYPGGPAPLIGKRLEDVLNDWVRRTLHHGDSRRFS